MQSLARISTLIVLMAVALLFVVPIVVPTQMKTGLALPTLPTKPAVLTASTLEPMDYHAAQSLLEKRRDPPCTQIKGWLKSVKIMTESERELELPATRKAISTFEEALPERRRLLPLPLESTGVVTVRWSHKPDRLVATLVPIYPDGVVVFATEYRAYLLVRTGEGWQVTDSQTLYSSDDQPPQMLAPCR